MVKKGTKTTTTVSFTYKGTTYTYPATATVSVTAKAKSLASRNNAKGVAYNGATVGTIASPAVYGYGVLKGATYTFNGIKYPLPLTKGDLAYFIGNGYLNVTSS